MQSTPLETVRSLAERFQLPTRTILREVLSGRLPYVNVAGHIRFRESDIRQWLESAGDRPRLELVDSEKIGEGGGSL